MEVCSRQRLLWTCCAIFFFSPFYLLRLTDKTLGSFKCSVQCSKFNKTMKWNRTQEALKDRSLKRDNSNLQNEKKIGFENVWIFTIFQRIKSPLFPHLLRDVKTFLKKKEKRKTNSGLSNLRHFALKKTGPNGHDFFFPKVLTIPSID